MPGTGLGSSSWKSSLKPPDGINISKLKHSSSNHLDKGSSLCPFVNEGKNSAKGIA